MLRKSGAEEWLRTRDAALFYVALACFLSYCSGAKIVVVGSFAAAARALHEEPRPTVYLAPDKDGGSTRRIFATLAEAREYFKSAASAEDWVWVLQGDSAERVSRDGVTSGSLTLGDRASHSAGRSGYQLQATQQMALCEEIAKVVQLAPRLWPGYKLAGRGLMVNTGQEVYAFGFREAILRQVFRTSGLDNQAPASGACGGMPFFRLSVEIEDTHPLLFVFGRSDGGDPRLGKLAELHKHPFLYVGMRAFDQGERSELRRTFVHEGAHLFLQGAEALQNEPEYCLGNQSTTCGRAALEGLYKDDPVFRHSVHRELCAARRLDEIRGQLENHTRPKDVVHLQEDLATQLRFMASERQRRGERYGTTNLEAFWYALEGVPSYLEEAEEREVGAPHGFSRYFPESCDSDSPLSYFYPLSCGGISWYALDLLEGSGRWKSPAAFLKDGDRELFDNLRRAIDRY
jgi:hypothetical protein